MFEVTKTYGHNLGLSATFRQWRASSHCRFLHGYALEVKFTFRAPRLNANNWVIDFGSLKPVKEWLCDTFDHKTLIAEDDPALPLFEDLSRPKRNGQLIDIVKVPATGCEGFARYIADKVNEILFSGDHVPQGGIDNGVFLYSVEVREHGANSAIYYPGGFDPHA